MFYSGLLPQKGVLNRHPVKVLILSVDKDHDRDRDYRIALFSRLYCGSQVPIADSDLLRGRTL